MTSIKGGILALYGHDSVRVELVDGSYHDTDSSQMAFFIASAIALDNALRTIPPRPSSTMTAIPEFGSRVHPNRRVRTTPPVCRNQRIRTTDV